MKKRIISVFMIIAMLCSVFPSVMAQSGLALTVTADKDNVNIGDELILTVSIKNAENIGAIQYTFNFDSNMLAYTGYTYGNTVKNNAYTKSVKKVNESNLGFVAVFVNKPLNGDEELCSFKFTVKDTAVDGRINYSVVNEKIGTGAVDAVALPEGSITYDEVMVSGTGVTNTLSVTADKTQAESGQTVKYSIEITPNELKGIQFDFTYDNTVFELDEFIFNEDIENVLMSDYNDKGGSITGMLAFSEATALSGQLAEAVFKVKETAPLGVTRVGIDSIKAKGAAGDRISIAAGNTPAVEINGIANPSLRFSTDKLVYMRGETVNIILHADNVVDFEGCQFTFEYNNEVFELDGECEALDMAEEALIADANTDEAGKIKAMLAFDTASAVTGSGDLYKIPLKVKGNSVYGSYGFNISEFKAKPENITAPTINGVEVRANSSSVELAITNSTQRAAAGDEVEYSIDLIDAAAIKGIQFDMKYDASRLELVSVTEGMANEASMNTDNVGEINVLHLFDIGSSFSGNGNLFKVIFKVKENAPVGTAAVEVENIKSDAEITYTAADSLEIYDNTVSLIVSASSDSTFAAKGDELKIKVGLKSNIEIGGVQMIFDYDDTALEYVGADFSGFNSNNNPMSSQCNNLGDGKLGLITVLRDAAIIDDTFAELTFNVKESAEKGRLDYNIINITDVNENPEAYSAETELSDIRIINRFSSLKADVSAAEVMPGEEVKFKIILSDLDEAEGIQFELKYDTDAFAFVGYEESDFISEVRNFGEPATETDGLITVLYAFSEPQSGDENEIGTLVLKAKDSYEAGNTTVTFNEVKLPVTIGSEHSIGVPVKTVDATVYIKNDNDLAEIVMGLIESIGNVTLNSKDAIERAEAAYAELTDEQKALVNNYNVLTTARTTYDRLLADKTAADEVIEAISAIGNVTLESNGKIERAEALYAALTDAQKALVSNYNVLTTARATYDRLLVDKTAADEVIESIAAIGNVTLESKEKIERAEALYAALTDAQKALVSNYNVLTTARATYDRLLADKTAADEVIESIAAIGNVTLESKEKIERAEALYTALTDAQKALVTNYNALTSARSEYNKLVDDRTAADEVIEAISAIGNVTLESNGKIERAEALYSALTNEQKALVNNYNVLTTARATYDRLLADKTAADEVIEAIAAIGNVTLESKEKIERAEALYAALTDEQKALVTNTEELTSAREVYDRLAADKAAVDNVIAAIDQLGEANIDSLEAITAAEALYNELAEELKERVTNYSALVEARNRYEEEKKAVDDVIALIDAIPEPVTKESLEAITAAETAFSALSEAQQAHITNKEALSEKRASYDAIKTVTFNLNYTGSQEQISYVNAGEKVSAPTNPARTGYTFAGWYTNKETTQKWDFENTIEGDITLYAKWNKKSTGGGGGGGGSSSGGGGIYVAPPQTKPEEPVDKPEEPAENNNNGTAVIFEDMAEHWARESVERLFAEGIVQGETSTLFNPNREVTRAEFSAMIYRLVKPAEVTVNSFTDVDEGSWYNTPISSLTNLGFLKGYDDGTFRPNNLISREEMAVIVSRVYDYLQLAPVELKGLDIFADKDEIAEWSAAAVDKLVSAGIINGYEDNTFRPKNNASRAHAAKVIESILKLIQ